MRITSEQEKSMHDALGRAGLRHGDEVRVRMAVGVQPSAVEADIPHITHCPAEVKSEAVVRSGGFFQHMAPIQGEIVYCNADEFYSKLQGKSGIAYFRARIITNGHVEIHVDPASVEVMPVPTDRLRDIRNANGRDLAQKALTLLS